MNYQEAIRAALNGHCLLFLGAGYSLGAETISGQNILSSKELAHELCKKVYVEITDDLKDASDDYIEMMDDIDKVIKELNSFFKVNKVESFHEIIASVPWRYVYTTNYDNVYELASANIGKNYKYITISTDIKNIPNNMNIIIHLNGMIEFLDRETLTTEFKLTNTNYTTTDFLNSDWYEKFIRDINMAEAIFFLGYSMYDVDIKKIFNAHPHLKSKIFFILGGVHNTRETRKIEKFGLLVSDKTTEDFSHDIKKEMSSFVPKYKNQLLTSFIETTFNSYSTKSFDITSDDVFNLFILGEFDKNKIYHDITTNTPGKYYIKRKELQILNNIFDSGSEKDILIQSDFGNGKSLMVEGIKAICVQKNINCYELIEESEETPKEVASILQQTDKQVIIIDNYPRYKKTLRHIADERPNNTFIVLTERTVVNTTNKERLLKILGKYPYTLTLDKIDDESISNLIHIFEENAFWRELSGKSERQKREKLANDYRCSMANILLGALRSKDIKNRLNSIYEELNENSLYKKIVTLVCIFGIINIKIDLHRILDILNTRIDNRVVFDTNLAVRQLFNNNTYEIAVKSPIFARFILNEFGTSDYIVSLLLKLYNYCCEKKHIGKWFINVLWTIDLFSNIQFILPEENRLLSSKKYFDGIRSLNNNSDNYHYWLQFAISRTVYGDFEHADNYFATSYSLFEKVKKNPTHRHAMLDNHYARFLMLRANQSNIEDVNFFDSFKKSDNIIQSQMFDDNTLHYPYRIALLYNDFYKRYSSKMSQDQYEYFISRVSSIYKRIETLDQKMLKNRYVAEAHETLSQLLQL